MELRTYYWNTRKQNFLKYKLKKLRNPYSLVLRYGNSGDIFNKDLIEYHYDVNPVNIADAGNRLLQVGSILKVVKPGDILNGIGWKGDQELRLSNFNGVSIFGVRGPLTYDQLKKKGVDVSEVKFVFDPGLLVKKMFNPIIPTSLGKPIFIPHYRDIIEYRGKYPADLKIINIDCKPKDLVNAINKSSLVYSSSLHGIIFAHALGKPCIFVKPQTKEPLLKYEDYYLSIGATCPTPMEDIYNRRTYKDHELLPDIKVDIDDFYVPSKQMLIDKQIMR